MADREAVLYRARFHHMVEGTEDDWAAVLRGAQSDLDEIPERIVAYLRLFRGNHGGFAVDRLEHGLQTASRAYRDGRDEEYVVCALLHDIGDELLPSNHAEMAAAILKPYVSERNHWMVAKHGVFQGYYFFQHVGLDRNMREQFHGHSFFEYTAEFCHLYDQASFDPGYESMPLEAFEPMLRRVLVNPRGSIYEGI